MSDRIFLMNQGRIVQSGDAETLYTAIAAFPTCSQLVGEAANGYAATDPRQQVGSLYLD